MGFAPDGRLFVAQKNGQLRVVSASGELLATPFVTVNVVTPSEKGLLGVTFDPAFATNRFVYVYYTNAADGMNQVSRFTASSSNPNMAEAGSETVILDNISGSSADNHNGGALHFGPDGKLYVAVGDNGTSDQAQQLGSVRGKILRLNANGSCPSDNPFVNIAGARCEVWARGLRNPFTFAFDPNNGAMRINDVGENTWEEINAGNSGKNYGWPACEGPQGTGVGDCSNPAYTYPIRAYQHSLGSAITGGAFYRGGTFPAEFAGAYFYSDYLGDFIRYIDAQGTDHAWRTANGPVDLKVGPDGALYYLSISDGAVRRIQAAGASPPPGDDQPPTAPSNLHVTSSTTTSVGLAWTASMDNVGVVGYHVDVNGVRVWTTNGTSYTHLGLSCGTTYTVAVEAFDAAGNLSAKAQLSTATTPCPPPPSSISQSISGGGTISGTVQWDARTSGATPANVHFLVDGTDRYTESFAPYCFNGDATCAINTTTLPNGSHTFRVESRSSSGDLIASDSDTASVENNAPPSSPPPPPAPPPPPPGDIQPGQSWNAAYQKASCGQTFQLGVGTHPSQTITRNASLDNCAQPVTFKGAPGVYVDGRVNLGQGAPDNGPRHVAMRDFSYRVTLAAGYGAQDILVENVNGGGFAVQGSNGVTVRNSDFGPCNSSPPNDCERVFILEDRNGGAITQNVLFEKNTIHDYRINAAGDHWECMFTTGGTNITIRGNKFWMCDTYGIATGDRDYSDYVNWIIENNWFGKAGDGTPVRTSAIVLPDIKDTLIRFNSFAPGQTIVTEGGTLGPNVRAVGNIFGINGCVPGVTYAQNIVIGTTPCPGTNAAISSAPYVNASDLGDMNYHLSGASIADGFVTSSSSDANLGLDFDGDSRSAPRDAGSDDRERWRRRAACERRSPLNCVRAARGGGRPGCEDDALPVYSLPVGSSGIPAAA
jgi:glucose/arabinose dehydrogenase